MQDRQSRELVDFLKSPASYPHRPGEVRSMETHISWVFIASPFVFKVKKTLSLGFLDFGTLEKRRHFCERELKLNRRLAPEIYLDVVPIYKSSSGFSFNEEGQVAEYAVKMKELPHAWSARRSLGEGGFLNELLEQNLVGEKEINRVITRLRQFYESEPPSAEIEEWGTPAKLKISTDENFIQVKPFVGKTISPAAFEAIRHFTNSFYAAKEKLFLERIQQHRIRDCHGDLHLDHIHITPETLSIFDCIEFNDRFRFINIANDVAFLAMDFDFEGRSDLANLLLHNAAREFQDSGMLKVSDFYKCYRAFVRGKVQSIQGLSMKTTTPEEHANQSARYFRLALRYAVTGSEPLMLVITGRVATGKTSVALQLGTELDWPVFSSDQIRKTMAGLPLTERTPLKRHDEIYSEQTTERTYRKLLEQGLAALQSQSGAVLDATFSSRAHRELLLDECSKANARWEIVELDVDLATIRARLKARDKSAGEISDARLEDFEKLNAAYEPSTELLDNLMKVSANDSVSETVKTILFQLAERQLR